MMRDEQKTKDQELKLAEEKLRKSEERYRNLVELSPDVIVVHSEGKIVFVNSIGAKIYGAASPDELIGKPVMDFVHPDYREIVRERIRQMLEDGKNAPLIEEKFILSDGSFLDAEVAAAPVAYQGKPAVQLIARDITARRRAEEALRESEARLRRITDNMLDMISQTNAEFIIEYISPSHKTILGYQPEDMLGRSVLDFVHPDDVNKAMTAAQKATASVSPGKIEYRCRHADGHYLWLESAGNLIFDDNGRIAGAIFCSRDITERKQGEEVLRESEERYRSLIELSPCGIGVYSEGKVVFVNRYGAKIYGVENPEELIGKPVMDFVHPDSLEIVRERVRKILEEGESAPLIEEKFILLDGTIVDVEVAAAPVIYQGKPAIQVVIHDITSRKRAEETLRLSEERFYKAFNASPNPMAINTLDGRYIEINKSFTRIVGYRSEEVLGLTPNDLNLFLSPDILVNALQLFHDQGELRNFEAYIRTRSGELRFGLFSADRIDLDGDKYILTIFNDITERKRMEEELRRREQFLNSIFESMQDRLSVIDTEFNIIRINKKVEESYSHELPLVGKKCYKAYHGEDDICAGCPGLKTIEDCEPAHAIVSVRDSSGNQKGWLDHYCYPFIDIATGDLAGVIVYARDITEKLRVEQELARMERFHLIGQMAAGIGHEIRNPMTAVRGFLQLLGNRREYVRHKEYFELMISELDRANSIIAEYLSLARNKPVDLMEYDLGIILKVLQPLITAEAMDAGIDLSVETGDAPTLFLNENEIRQLILNLVKNGLEAMGHGGRLSIRTFTDNGEVVLSVQDQGPGIKPELLDKIGTPFLTTKDKGTGLGLAVCYGIAARHNAVIAIDTGPAGTTFFVRFKLRN